MAKSRATEDQLEPEGAKRSAIEDPADGDTEGHMFQRRLRHEPAHRQLA